MVPILTESRHHLRACRENYLEHLKFASRAGAAMVGAGLACMVHGLLPGLFETTGSRTVKSLAVTFTNRGVPAEKNPTTDRAWS
jgi:hypothetical protein